MADMMAMGGLVVAVLNAALASALVAVYGGVYGKTKAPFTLALLVFGVAFLLQNLLVLYSYATMMVEMPPVLTPYLLGIGVLEAGGLGAMVWTATR